MVAKTIRCTSLVVLGFLFVMHALRDFSTLAHHGKENDGNEFSRSEENLVTVPKENIDGTTRKIGVGGRKMAGVEKVLMKEKTHDEKELQGMIGVNGQISGNFNDAPNKFFRISQNQLNHQSKINMLETQVPAHDDKDETQRLLEEEIVNLMHKDYTGMNRPCRKPPVNNHEPSN